MKRIRHFLLILLLLILIRVPALLFWNNYLTGNDAAIYLEKGIHLVEGKGFTSSICRFLSEPDDLRDYVAKFGTRTQEIKVAPLYIFLISGLYSVFGERGLMLAINVLNLLLFISLLWVIYFRIVPLFSPNHKIGLVALLIVGLNYTYFEGMYGAHMETLSLFLFTCAFAWHAAIVGKERTKWYELAGYCTLLSLLFLSKYSAIPFVGAFVLHHLLLGKYSRFVIVGLLVSLLAGSWFIVRDALLDGRVISNFTHTPFKTSTIQPKSSIIARYFFRSVRVGRKFIQILFDIDGLALLLPFSAVFLMTKGQDRIKQGILLLLSVALVFYVYFGYLDLRYLYPVFIPLIPASLAIFYEFLKKYGNKKSRSVVTLLLVIFSVYQLHQMLFFTTAVRKQAKDRQAIFAAADALLDKSGVTEKANILTNILGYNVYSELGVVMAPSGLTSVNKHSLIDIYGVDYVLYCADQMDTKMAWDQYATQNDVFTDLNLINISEDDPRVRLYAAKGLTQAVIVKESE